MYRCRRAATRPLRGNKHLLFLPLMLFFLSGKVAADNQDTCCRSSAIFPSGNLFYPLLAAPKEARTFISQYKMDSEFPDASNVALVAYGGHYGLYRFSESKVDQGWQISFTAALFAQFNLDKPSDDLVNADYTFGFTLTHRRGSFSSRFRIYHQSSHLGDELLLNNSLPKLEWMDINFESLEALLAWQYGRWRLYGGGEYILRQAESTRIDPPMVRFGLEFRGSDLMNKRMRFIGGLDLASRQELGWSVDTSFKAGLELGDRELEGRNLRVLLGIYDGHLPYGQFYADKARSVGLELALSF